MLVLVGPTYGQAPSGAGPPAGDTSNVAFQVRMPDSVVVTASRVASAARTTGRRVSVYTRQDIASLSVNSVDQLLDVVAGLDVQSRGGFGVQSDLKMRGSTFNGVLLLLDGARVNDPYTGHFLMDLPVPLSEIARVEVLHGPATALYGPDALGGVVHLITKTALRGGAMPAAGLSARAEASLANAREIGEALFSGGALRLEFELQAEVPEREGDAPTPSQVFISIHGTDDAYRMGSFRPWVPFSWPGRPGALLSISTQQGDLPAKQYNGDWALFRLLGDAQVRRISQTQYELQWPFRQPGQYALTAQYMLRAKSASTPFGNPARFFTFDPPSTLN